MFCEYFIPVIAQFSSLNAVAWSMVLKTCGVDDIVPVMLRFWMLKGQALELKIKIVGYDGNF